MKEDCKSKVLGRVSRTWETLKTRWALLALFALGWGSVSQSFFFITGHVSSLFRHFFLIALPHDILMPQIYVQLYTYTVCISALYIKKEGFLWPFNKFSPFGIDMPH